ncbi:MAG: S49 family peptidase [Proteobacteria bacterium]|nr:S49 family peptidase [Pseudomonadota bacterium]
MSEWLRSLIDLFRRNPPPVVAAIRLEGPIGPATRMRTAVNLEGVAKLLAQAFSMRNLEAVALSVNSPGGSPVQSALIMQRVRALAKERDVPVLVFAEDVAASGGYLLALAGDEIFAHETSIIGSIGVVFAGFGFSEAIAKLGIERRLYTAGEDKAILDPFSPEKEKDVARLRDLQAEVHDYFKDVVKERRGQRLKGPRAKLFSGDVWTGKEALELGLIDGIGEMRSVLRERFGENVRIRKVAPRKRSLTSLFGLATLFDRGSGEIAAASWADDLLAAVEARALWDRFGL